VSAGDCMFRSMLETQNELERSRPRPIVKWAGGKRLLLPEITSRIPTFSGAYIEPFLGGGSVALSLDKKIRKKLSDSNSELINAYLAVRDFPEELIAELRKHRNNREHFLKVRAWDRKPGFENLPTVIRAARFIFLNKTCFNGLYRVNSQGKFNVPYGNQPNTDFVSQENIRLVSKFLSQTSTKIYCRGFEESIRRSGANDFIYVDPPYDPINQTSSFVSYQARGFDAIDQEHLRDLLLDAHSRGAQILASNNDTPFIRKLYSPKLGWKIEKVTVPRLIGAAASSRGNVEELLMTLTH
jgi:DNA adenine methylase